MRRWSTTLTGPQLDVLAASGGGCTRVWLDTSWAVRPRIAAPAHHADINRFAGTP